MELLILFTTLTILNTIIQTIKSIATIKCGKTMAAFINAIAYGLYTYVIIFTSADGMSIHAKAIITALANLIGVYVVKLIEEKSRKAQLWKVEATVSPVNVGNIQEELDELGISHNCFRTSGEHRVFNIFCPTQKDSANVKTILNKYNAKYFVSESKTL